MDEGNWEHAARRGKPALEAPVKVVWYHGGRSKRDRPEIETGMDLSKWFNGILFVGDKGMLLADYGKRVLLPKDKFEDFSTQAMDCQVNWSSSRMDTQQKPVHQPYVTLSTQEVLLNITCWDQWLIAWVRSCNGMQRT